MVFLYLEDIYVYFVFLIYDIVYDCLVIVLFNFKFLLRFKI